MFEDFSYKKKKASPRCKNNLEYNSKRRYSINILKQSTLLTHNFITYY